MDSKESSSSKSQLPTKPGVFRWSSRAPVPKPKPEPIKIHDVFLSFRGEDTRASFTSHLYSALQNAGVKVCIDDIDLQRGDHISTSLSCAIEQSQISIIVFSKNYADSRWCMDELDKIMQCHRTIRQVVVPVFYHVDPSEVRHQKGEFGIAFQCLLDKISKEIESKLIWDSLRRSWKERLRQAANIAGFVIVNSRNESDDIKDIVDKVLHLLNKTDLFIVNNPVGIESRVEDVIQLLHTPSNRVELLGMWGMGGIGKTTIAKAIYNKIGRNFEGRSFLANIREDGGRIAGQVSLQEQLLFDICKETTIKIPNIESGKNTLKHKLCHRRVLIVLDDVNTLDQLNTFCGSREWFGSGSIIIITTRDLHLLSGRVDKIYKMTIMNEDESIEIFSWNAFKQASPREDFDRISKNVVEYSGGLPLALEVLGSYLFDRGLTEWHRVLEKLKRIPNAQVQNKLRISYDGLNDDDEQEIFIDIACFFIGMDRNDVIHILNGSGLYAEIGINILVERSLVTVDDKNKLGMHDLLRDMGREIIREESPNEPAERRRLWFNEDVLDVLSEQTGTQAVEGLALNMLKDDTNHFSTKAFEKMNKLRLLQLTGVQLDGDFDYLSRKLRWLCWNGFPLTCIPTNLFQGNLVSMELENSNIRLVWKENQRMEKLKILNLSHSRYLKQTPDFSYLPNLEKLVLADCPRLSKICHSIGVLKKILLINLEDCTGLYSLPRSIYKLKSLKTLNISGCLMIDKLEDDLEQMESLTNPIANNNAAITRVPFFVVRSKSIGYILLCDYEGFSEDVFPSIISSWMSSSWMSPTHNLSPQFQTSPVMSAVARFDVQHSISHELLSFSKYLPNLRSLWVECSSEQQFSHEATIVLEALYATLSKKLESTSATSQASNTNMSELIQYCSQLHVSGSKDYLKTVVIQMGMNCKVTNNLKKHILQTMGDNVYGGRVLPGNSYVNRLTVNCKGSSVTFQVPQVEGRMFKTMMICIRYSSTPPHNLTSDGLTNLLVKNYTKATIQLYKGEALVPFENEEGCRVVSSIKPGNKVEFVVVFKNGFIVKNTTVYLIYDEPISEIVEECHAEDKNVIVSSDAENECFVREVSPQVAPVDYLVHNKRKNVLMWIWMIVKEWLSKINPYGG